MIFVQNSQSLKSDDVSNWPLPNKIPGCASVAEQRDFRIFDLGTNQCFETFVNNYLQWPVTNPRLQSMI